MEICILKFDGSHSAEDAFKEVVDAQGDRNAWLHDIGTIARPLIGRVRVGATFPDGKSQTFHEGDLADAVESLGAYTGYYVSSIAGPFSMVAGAINAGLAARAQGEEAEQRLLHLDDLKKALPRDSSALVLIADTQTCDAMVKLFKSYSPKVVRRQVADELRQRLDTLHRQFVQEIAQAEAEGAPAPH
jgi:hypothetical protein